MLKAENSEPQNGSEVSSQNRWFAIIVIGGIVLSFLIGAVFFLTIAQQRSGVAIPIDAAPRYYIHDAESPS